MSGCRTRSCGNEAALNGALDGFCIPCYNADYNRRRRPDNGEPGKPWEHKKPDEVKIDPETPAAPEEEKDMTTKTTPKKSTISAKPREKHKACKGCGRDKKETGRLYNGLCGDCRKRPVSGSPSLALKTGTSFKIPEASPQPPEDSPGAFALDDAALDAALIIVDKIEETKPLKSERKRRLIHLVYKELAWKE